MTHTQASRIFREKRLPQHAMNIYARMVTTLYLVGRYGARVQRHSRRIAVALERMEVVS